MVNVGIGKYTVRPMDPMGDDLEPMSSSHQ